MAVYTAEREQFLADVITGAVEGGTNYWACVLSYKWVDRPSRDVFAILAEDSDGEFHSWADEFLNEHGHQPRPDDAVKAGKAYSVTIDKVEFGIKMVLVDEFSINSTLREVIRVADRDNDAGLIDAEAADIIVQAALFGEIRYG